MIIEMKGDSMNITEYVMEEIFDPTGLITGERYEFKIYVDLEEDDELYRPEGIGIRTILAVDNDEKKLVVAHFFDRSTEEALAFELEDEEFTMIESFCIEQYEEDA